MNFGYTGYRMCLGKKKDGSLCSLPCLKFYLKGHYWIEPQTCHHHKGQKPDKKDKNIYE